jgi:hypothetical protein
VKNLLVSGLGFALVLAVLTVAPETTAHRVYVSGSGSGAFEDPRVGGGGVGYAECTLDRTLQTIDCQTRLASITSSI